jgi:hypothetical protein
MSGSTPPVLWILPPTLLVFMALYGVAALVIRELALRNHGGAATVLLLGLAFGIVNEGMAVHSLFNPAWPGVDVLGSYGRWAGVNWLWTEWIVPFHAVWSISFPIFLCRQFWPDAAERRFLSDRSLVLLAPIPIVVAVVGSFYLQSYRISILDWVGTFAAVFALGAVAWRWGPVIVRLRPGRGWIPTPAVAATVGFGFFVIGQVGTWATPGLGPYPEVGFALLGLAWLGVGLLAMTFDRTARGERARFAFVIGGVGFYTALTPLTEFGLGRVGLLPIDVVALVLLVRLYYRRTKPVPTPTAPPGAAGGVPPLDRTSA